MSHISTFQFISFVGDEFVVYSPTTEQEESPAHCCMCLKKELVNRVSECEKAITASIGVACYPDNGEFNTSLLKAAGDKLYKAKESGRNCFAST